MIVHPIHWRRARLAGTVVVTINYRLGALGFLAHPALAARPGGPAGNYGLMDQQAAPPGCRVDRRGSRAEYSIQRRSQHGQFVVD